MFPAMTSDVRQALALGDKQLLAVLLLSGALVGLLEDVVGLVEGVVPFEEEDAPLQAVGATARHQVDLRTAAAAELGAIGVAVDLELLGRLHRGIDQDGAVGADVVVAGAVDASSSVYGVGDDVRSCAVRPLCVMQACAAVVWRRAFLPDS